MTTKDSFGRTVTVDTDGVTYSVKDATGVLFTVVARSADAAMLTINAMAPESYEPPSS